MSVISMTAAAGLDVCRQIAAGELEVGGILVREVGSKKIRYILRGLESLPKDMEGLAGFPPLAPLSQAIGITQLLGVVAIAQNAATALSLKRIERRIEEIERRLSGIEQRLARIDMKTDLLIANLQRSPVFRLKAALRSAAGAYRDNDRTALRAAAKDADEAAHNILDQARELVRREMDGVPYALWAANELGDLVESGTEAVRVASALYLALGEQNDAIMILADAANAIETMRGRLHSVFTDPELMLRRISNDRGNDAQIITAGEALRNALHVFRGRELMIRQGLIVPDPERIEFEKLVPGQDMAFVEVTFNAASSAAHGP